MDRKELQKHANNIRINIIKEVANANSGHPGGSLSAADIVTVLYFLQMRLTQLAQNKKSIPKVPGATMPDMSKMM